MKFGDIIGNVFLIIGATRGVGSELTRLLYSSGAAVVLPNGVKIC